MKLRACVLAATTTMPVEVDTEMFPQKAGCSKTLKGRAPDCDLSGVSRLTCQLEVDCQGTADLKVDPSRCSKSTGAHIERPEQAFALQSIVDGVICLRTDRCLFAFG